MKNAFGFVLLVLVALVMGGLIASWTGDVEWLQWLSYSKAIGISPETPMVIDLSILRLTFGAEINVNVIQVLLLIGSYFAYKKWFN